MNDTKLLVGSLSNDLFRVASLRQRGLIAASEKFWLRQNFGPNLCLEKKPASILKQLLRNFAKFKPTN